MPIDDGTAYDNGPRQIELMEQMVRAYPDYVMIERALENRGRPRDAYVVFDIEPADEELAAYSIAFPDGTWASFVWTGREIVDWVLHDQLANSYPPMATAVADFFAQAAKTGQMHEKREN
jgi:hypothetical protein